MKGTLNGGELLSAYVWGLDLYGSTQRGGGIGSLLLENISSNHPVFVSCDGNGNITHLTDANTSNESADYEYGAFGEVIRATGSMAIINNFQFASKYQDKESTFLYYGHRYYNPMSGRWLNPDPIGTKGGFHSHPIAA